MSFTAEDVIRPEVGFLLRGDYRRKFLCSRCFVTLIRERLGTNLSTSKIERALNAVFKSPGALTRLPLFLCNLCQTGRRGLATPPSTRLEAGGRC